ncbi:MAG: MOSC domain-containing protein [Gemmatimonadetes bacterium]|nr:MOSC domain-containing protein [Gemmatimonadota bacterium]
MKVTGLFVYPLKSARALSLQEAHLDEFGIRGDRRWCLVDDDGRVITQRESPVLATLDVVPSADGLELRAVRRPALRVRTPGPDQPVCPAQVRADHTEGRLAGAGADAWLSDLLGRSCHLLHMPPSTRRQVSLTHGRPGDRVSFADGYPLLLTNEASLAALNERLPRAVPMDRFRPNLVIDGVEPFAEDGWSRIRAGGTEFRVVKPCARCVVTTTDQQTGDREKEPLRTLATFRNVGGKVLFGENLIHEGTGPIRLGDGVEVVETR